MSECKAMCDTQSASFAPRRPWLYSRAARVLSFILACALSALILVNPQVIAASPGQIQHGALAVLMWGIAAGFVHGVGYVPVYPVWRIALGPLVGLPVMVSGIVWLAYAG